MFQTNLIVSIGGRAGFSVKRLANHTEKRFHGDRSFAVNLFRPLVDIPRAGLPGVDVDRNRRHVGIAGQEFDHPGADCFALAVEHQVQCHLKGAGLEVGALRIRRLDEILLHVPQMVAHLCPLHRLVIPLSGHASALTGGNNG